MFKPSSSLAAALGLFCLAAAPAIAQSPVTFVSGKGTDAGNCAAPASPCRTFQFALGLTNAGGEIKALDPANYFAVFINKSINITGVEGAGIIRGTAGDAVTITAPATAVVTLSNLTIDGVNKTATNGVLLNSASRLTIRNCTAQNFSQRGVNLRPSTALTILIVDLVATDNGEVGVHVFAQLLGSAIGALDHVVATKNKTGIATNVVGAGAVDMTVVDSVANDNSISGFLPGGGTTLRLSRSTATRNSVGVLIGGTATSAGNNFINGNTTNDVQGTLDNVGTL